MLEGRDEAIFPNNISSVIAAIRAVLDTHPYRDTREDAGHTTFETTIEIPWSLVSMPLAVTVTTEEGQTVVRATVRSRWWVGVDAYGSRDTSIRRFFAALSQRINQ